MAVLLVVVPLVSLEVMMVNDGDGDNWIWCRWQMIVMA